MIADLGRRREPTSALDGVEVLRLGDPPAGDEQRVGGKAAQLSRLASRFPVPTGICLPVEAHRRLHTADRRSAARALRRLLAPAYRDLGDTAARRPQVAVRSSAVDEDTAAASFAGQHDTVLNAVGLPAVVDAVLTCWASASSERAQAYRTSHGLEQEGRMAVLIQELIDADVAAVVFSADPVSGARNRVVINASWGLGEAVVAGVVTPDTYVVARDGGAILDRDVADKDRAVVPSRRGTREVAVPRDRRRLPALDDEQCRELARLAIGAEQHTGWPVDLECAYHNGRLALLQCRPITSLPTWAG